MPQPHIPTQTTPLRSPEATARLAWLILSLSMVCFCLVCTLAGYGLWRFRASIMGPQDGNSLEAYASPVSHTYPGETQRISVPPRQVMPLREGETVQVGDDAPPGVTAFVNFWDGSTLQLYAGTTVVMERLQATLYSDQTQEIALRMPSGQVLVGVARTGRYEHVRFTVLLATTPVELEPGGTYLLRAGERTEVAVRRGQAQVTTGVNGSPLTLAAGQKVVIQPGQPWITEPAEWSLLREGDFAQELRNWSFRSDQAGDGGYVPAVYRLAQQYVNDQLVWTLGLERKGGIEDRCQGILSQEIEADLSPYQSVPLKFDLRLNYQSLPGGGLLGVDYPFAVRIRYQDAEGKSRQYLYGFYYHTAKGYKTQPESGEAIRFPHYRWERVSLDLLKIRPTPVLLNGVDLMASGQDYLSWVANVSLTARLSIE